MRCWAWWQPRATVHLLAAPAIYWTALLAGVFPALGVNALPESVQALGKTREIALFDGPQPAMLPIASQRALRHYGQFDRYDLAELQALKALIFLEERDLPRLQQAAAAAGLQLREAGRYSTLASHGSGLRFARVGATADDWRRALTTRDLAPLKTTVLWFELEPQ